MATQLSKATKNVKRYLVYFMLFVILVLLLNWITSLIKDPIDPGIDPRKQGYPKENQLFKQIPIPKLQSIPIDPESQATIGKDTTAFPVEPALPPVVYIYKIKPERESAGEAGEARLTAKALGFSAIETKAINNVLYWEPMEKNRTLQYDKAQRLWNYRLATYPQASADGFLPTAQEYLSIAFGYMGSLQMKPDNMNSPAGRSEYIQLTPQGAISNIAKEKNAVKVALNKSLPLIEPTDKKKPVIFGQVRKYKYSDGTVNMIINGKGKTLKDNLLQLSYKNYSYEDTPGVYPVMDASTAFQKISAKKGFLYRLVLNDSNEYTDTATTLNVKEFTINAAQTTMVFIEPDNRSDSLAWTNYLQPFFLFEGTFVTSSSQEGKCAFLVPALSEGQYQTE